MSEERRPLVKLFANVPLTAKLTYDKPMSGKKTDDEGKEYTWYLWGIEVDGQAEVLSCDKKLVEALEGYGKGDTLIITKEEHKSEGQRTYYTYTVRQAIFEGDGKKPTPKPNIANDPEQRSAFQQAQETLMTECVQKAYRIAAAIKTNPQYADLPEPNMYFVTKLTMAFYADFQRSK